MAHEKVCSSRNISCVRIAIMFKKLPQKSDFNKNIAMTCQYLKNNCVLEKLKRILKDINYKVK